MNIAALADARASCPDLSDREWSAIQGLGHVIGERQVLVLLGTVIMPLLNEWHSIQGLGHVIGERQVLVLLGNNAPVEHQRIAFNFLAKENASLRDAVAQRERREANEARPQRPKPLKLHVPLYRETHRISLGGLCQLSEQFSLNRLRMNT
jgi:hypothetical protein